MCRLVVVVKGGGTRVLDYACTVGVELWSYPCFFYFFYYFNSWLERWDGMGWDIDYPDGEMCDDGGGLHGRKEGKCNAGLRWYIYLLLFGILPVMERGASIAVTKRHVQLP